MGRTGVGVAGTNVLVAEAADGVVNLVGKVAVGCIVGLVTFGASDGVTCDGGVTMGTGEAARIGAPLGDSRVGVCDGITIGVGEVGLTGARVGAAVGANVLGVVFLSVSGQTALLQLLRLYPFVNMRSTTTLNSLLFHNNNNNNNNNNNKKKNSNMSIHPCDL